MSGEAFEWRPAAGEVAARGRARYAHWDGSQRLGDIDADELLDALSEDVMSDGDLDDALRRAIEEGMPGRKGEQGLPGLRDLMRRLADRRREILDRHGLDDLLGDLRRELQEIVDTERRGIARRLDAAGLRTGDAREPGEGTHPAPKSPADEARPPDRSAASPPSDTSSPVASAPGSQDGMRRMLRDMAERRRGALDALPADPGGRIRALEEYEFLEPAARDAFQHLLERLRGRMLDATFQGLADQLRTMAPEDLQSTREMMRDLGRLLQERLDGGNPDATEFLRKHGEAFPGAQNLDDVIDQLAERMAAMQSLLRSMTPEQRAELGSLMDALLRDDRLRFDLARLAGQLDRLLPGGLGGQFPFRGDDELGLEQALDEIGTLQQLDRLGDQLAGASDPPALADVDPEEVARLLGDESADDLAALQRAAKVLEEAGYAARNGDRLELTARGQRRIGQRVLDEVFGRLGRDAFGGHRLPQAGTAGERSGTSSAYEFGRPFDLDLRGTLDHAVGRDLEKAGTRRRGLSLEPGDFQVFDAEELTSASTVLLLDMSRSMLLRGCFVAAKKVAVALDTLIRTRYPRDTLHVVGFAYVAHEIPPGTLATLSWQGHEYGTNLQHALMLSRRLLARGSPANRSIIVITDGEPTAHIEDGRVEFNYPPTRRTIEETLREVGRCTREGITINTFMLERSRALGEFVDRLSRMNHGRAFYASPERLEEFVLVDYLERRTRRVA
jgi:uncharacterized protein with von Willebrand factor type A (vWA) domain